MDDTVATVSTLNSDETVLLSTFEEEEKGAVKYFLLSICSSFILIIADSENTLQNNNINWACNQGRQVIHKI